jgi:predicted AAA+ superfamily ATPase
MITRIQQLPKKSFLLFGPRGVGKSTLLKEQIKAALYINLLKSEEYLKYSRNPDQLLEVVKVLASGSWVVIDEIQRVPDLLNIVHEIYEQGKIHFGLSGSSARKLKRGGANLLAGRALQTFLYPFAFPEFKNLISINEAVEWGTLPLVINEAEYKKETLSTYVETYLREELVQEGIIRNVDSFLRFLNIAGIMNGQTINFENIARESHTARTTVQTYFEILIDTLIGFYLPAFMPKLKVKEAAKPKFYFFDSGVARASAGLLSYELDTAYKGFLFETFLINQVKMYNEYSKKKFNLYYYGISGSNEIDLIIETQKNSKNTYSEILAIEFKLGKKWKSEWKSGFKILDNSKKIVIKKKILVYSGTDLFESDGIQVYSVEIFLEKLFVGEIF